MIIPEFTLESVLKVYFYIAIFATILFVLKLAIFSIFGGDCGDSGADFTSSTDTDASFNFLSIQSVLAFLMGFGWMGYTCIHQMGVESHLKTFLISLSVGVVFMCLNAFLMFAVKKLESTVKKDKSTAVGHTGKAYTSFEPKSSGQVEIQINGQLSVVNALNITDEHINSFDPIKVVKVEDEILHIEKI